LREAVGVAVAARVTVARVEVAVEPRYYRETATGDFLMVYSEWVESGAPRKLNVRAANLAGNPLSVCGAEIEPGYLRRCRQVAAAEVPARWMASFVNFLRPRETA
jgi:hypothetical protein